VHQTSLTVRLQMIWKRMLEAVDFIHSQRVIHSDLKPANFLFVKGELKLIDFGIARSMNSDTTNIQVHMHTSLAYIILCR
jgi:serine/threonine-protein kinase TTK/MPS1